MRTVMLSLKPDVFNNVLSGEKIYEHRKVFPEGPVTAYIYISRPVQALAGILYLDNKIQLKTWKDKYGYDLMAVERIDKYLERYNVAMEIQKFQNTTSISLEDIKKEFPDFLIPQMYYYLDDLPLLDYLQRNLTPIEPEISHEFNDIDSKDICVH
jgi:predicted transcriptional regulator